MYQQALDEKELLNIRWAYEDPNPKSQNEKLADWTDQVLTAAEQRGLLEHESDPKRRRLDAYPGQAVGPAGVVIRMHIAELIVNVVHVRCCIYRWVFFRR